MNLLLFNFSLALPLLVMAGCNLPANSPPVISPEAQSKSFVVEEIEFTFPYPATWGEVISERWGADVDCPPLEEDGISLCSSTSESTQKLTFTQKNDTKLVFIGSGDGGGESLEKLPHFCDTQSKDEPLLIDEKVGYCGKTEEGKITFTTLMQPEGEYGEVMADTPIQQIFYQLQPGKFDELTVYKTLPVSEECRKALADKLALEVEESERCRQSNNSQCEFPTFPIQAEEAKRCIQESMRLFAAETERTQEGGEFRVFLKGLATAK